MSARAYKTQGKALHDASASREMMQHPSLEVLPLLQLKPYARNARTHSKKQIRQIARSIERFGFTNPVLIDEGDRIIAGHGRVAAALQLGLSAVPTLRISHLSETDKRAYILADNRLAEKAGWTGRCSLSSSASSRGCSWTRSTSPALRPARSTCS